MYPHLPICTTVSTLSGSMPPGRRSGREICPRFLLVFVEYFWRHAGMQFALVFVVMLLFSGCLGKSQGEVRAMPPSHTGTFEQPYARLAACAKA